MTLRRRLLTSTVVAGLAALTSLPADAGLIGSGRTVLPGFEYVLNGTPGVENPNNIATSTNLPASLASPVSYGQGAISGATILVGDTQITITNQLTNMPFCLNPTGGVGTACNDPYDTFRFTFTGENITGVSVDPASAVNFQPATFGAHLGLQFIGPNEIAVDVAGDKPAVNDSLILDLSFAAPPPPPPPPPTGVPEPASLSLLGAAAGGMFAVRRRRPRR
jgi:hypothetical protein